MPRFFVLRLNHWWRAFLLALAAYAILGTIGSDQDFQYEFEADLRPSFELGEYKGLAIESQLAPVLDEEVEEGLAHFRRRQARPEPAGEEGLAASGMAICKLELLHEGQVVLERDGLRLNAESALPGTDPEA